MTVTKCQLPAVVNENYVGYFEKVPYGNVKLRDLYLTTITIHQCDHSDFE